MECENTSSPQFFEMSLSPMSSFSPTSAPSVMKPNPSGCVKFVVNVFKAGSGRCRDCGHEWFQHEGVIDKAIAEKFRVIWNSGDRRPSPVASGVPPLPLQSVNQVKTMKDLKEEKRRALLAKRTNKSGEDWFNGGGDSGRSSSRRSVDENGDSDEDEFKFYSRDEFLARESSRSSSVNGSGSSNAKPVKVVNLIEFDGNSLTPVSRPVESVVSVSVIKLEEMESLLKSLQNELGEKDRVISELEKGRQETSQAEDSLLRTKISHLESLLLEKDSAANTARAESSRLLDELDRVMLESNRKVRELEDLLVEQGKDEKFSKQAGQDRVNILEEQLAEYRLRTEEMGRTAGISQSRQTDLEKIVTEKDALLQEYSVSLANNGQELEQCRFRIGELETDNHNLNKKFIHSMQDQENVRNRIAELETLKNEKETEIRELSEREVKKIDEMKRVAESQSDEILKLRKEVEGAEGDRKKCAAELVGIRNQMESESARWVVESARLRSEIDSASQRLTDSVEQVRTERNNSIELQGRLMRAEETIENLNDRLKRSSDELNNSQRIGDDFEQIRDANEHYLDAIADVAIVLRTACDKYLTPHSSMANSRTHSVEDVGSGVEAIRVLESNVKSALRMIDNVYEKCRYLEKENTKLETSIYDLQLINQGLKEKMNKSFMQRLFEPVMACGLPGNSSPQSGGAQGHGSPIVRNYLRDHQREMSHLLPPDQVSMLDDPDVH